MRVHSWSGLPREPLPPWTIHGWLRGILSHAIREGRQCAGRVHLLVGNVKPTKLTTLSLKLQDIVNGRQPYVIRRTAAVYRRGRVTDRAPTTTIAETRRRAPERRRPVRTPKWPVRATRPFITTSRFTATWLFRTTWPFGSTRSPQDLTVDTAAESSK